MSFNVNPNIPNVHIITEDPITKLCVQGYVIGAPLIVANAYAPQCNLIGVDGLGTYTNQGTALNPVFSYAPTKTNNVVLTAPGLEIHGASSPTVKNANSIQTRVGGILGVPIASGDWVALNGPHLVNDMCRMYTFLIAVNPTTGATTESVVYGADFTHARPVNVLTDVNLGDGTTAIAGFLYVKNESGADFIPGTTDLDASGITTSYNDAYGYPLIGAPLT